MADDPLIDVLTPMLAGGHMIEVLAADYPLTPDAGAQSPRLHVYKIHKLSVMWAGQEHLLQRIEEAVTWLKHQFEQLKVCE